MSAPPLDLPPSVVSRLFRVERPLLVSRYRDALSRIDGRTSTLDAFHIDAAGYSPEIAAELDDPYYLGQGISHPYFVIVSVDQLEAPLLQPNVGFAGPPFRRWSGRLRSELADLTMTEPVFGEITHGLARLGHPAQLGLVRDLRLQVSTPSDRLGHAVNLGVMEAELLAVESAWRDEEFLARMAAEAREAKGWTKVRPDLVSGETMPAEPSYLPDFGGCYVWPGRGDDSALAWVLHRGAQGAADASWLARAEEDEVFLLPLTEDGAEGFLVEMGLVKPQPDATDYADWSLEALQIEVARDHLRKTGDIPTEPSFAPLRAMRAEAELPLDFQELEDFGLRLRTQTGPVDLAGYSTKTRLRLMPLATSDETIRWWVSHLRAYLDPILAPLAAREPSGLMPGLFPGACRESS